MRIPRRGVAGIVKKYYKRLSEFVNCFLQPNVDVSEKVLVPVVLGGGVLKEGDVHLIKRDALKFLVDKVLEN